MFEYIDVHSHIHGKEYDSDRDEVVRRMREGKGGTIVVGTDLEESRRALLLAEREEGIFAAIGQHPSDSRNEVFNREAYEILLKSNKIVAIGECGLDYFRKELDTENERMRQKLLFKAQIELAISFNKPLMIHCRAAHDDMLNILKDEKQRYGAKLFGNIHFFTGTLALAESYIELGFTLSFPGVITFTKEYDEVVKSVPHTEILSETDSPYATPLPYRGVRNEPAYVVKVIEKIADLRGEALSDIKRALVANAKRVFSLEG